MVGETHFQRYLPEPHPEELVAPEEIKRHILCTGNVFCYVSPGHMTDPLLTGQVYHTLLAAREERGIKDIAISRVEQISPFPYDLVSGHAYISIRSMSNSLFSRSLLTSTSTPMLAFSGVRKSLLTTVHGAMSALVSTLLVNKPNTTKASTPGMLEGALPVLSLLEARSVIVRVL